MKILKFDEKKGEMTLQIETLNDLWVLYNVIFPGDKVEARTVRRVVVREGEKGDRKPMKLGITVEDVSFYEFANRLRIKGQIYAGPNDLISIGRYHTLNIEPNQSIKVIKEIWYDHLVQRIKKSAQAGRGFQVLVIPIDSGDAIVALLSNYSQTIIARVHENLPGKRYGKQAWEQELEKFLGTVAKIVEENLSAYEIRLIVVAGPGFVKEKFADYLQTHVAGARGKVNLESATSAEDSAIYEVLRKGTLQVLQQDQRVVFETDLMEEVMRRVGKDEPTVTFGIAEAQQACQFGAIETFLISDVKFRESRGDDRDNIEKLLRDIESANGKVEIVSSLHPAGEQLLKLGGYVGLLRFRVDFTA
ncbi:MAG TPA: mRNA surveillance protein pelota [Candidatus Lokiarchaeia archaeon]|nr:mRNA surveillance protein pelota [Candidatus Lokiarchaeia archaeon]